MEHDDGEARPLPTHRWQGIRYFDSEGSPKLRSSDRHDRSEERNLAGGEAQVVLVHGLGNSLQFWVSVAPLLSRSARVVAMDIPGFGKSEPAERNDLESYVAAIAGLLDHLGVRDCHVVGHSMGSVVAAALAHRQQPPVASLTLLDGIPFRAIDMIRSAGLALRDPALAVNLASQFIGGVVPLGSIGARAITGSALMRRLTLWPYVVDTGALRADVAAVALMDNGGIGPLRAISLARHTPPDELVLVPSVPVRVICGEEDRLVNREDVEATVQRYNAVDRLIVTGSGHWPLLEKPEVVASYITSYL